jgi:hypothetical protein
MAGNLLNKYGTSNQAITCTITSLANNGLRQSTAVDNSSNLFQDAVVHVKVKANAAGTSSTGYVNIYIYGTADGGTTYGDTVTGTDGAVTLTNPPNLKLLGIINVVANAATYNANFSIFAALGFMPEKWGIVVENKTGAALDASVGNAFYQGVYGSYT